MKLVSASLFKNALSSLNANSFCNSTFLRICGTRYSSYGPDYIEAIHKKEDLDRIKGSEEAKKLAHVPIKAARNEQSTSVFYDSIVEKFVNYVMRDGKKLLAREQVRKTLETIKRIQLEKYHKETDLDTKNSLELDPLIIFHKAVDNCKPILSIKPIRKGGSTYQVPIPISDKKATFLSMNWLIQHGKAPPKSLRFYQKLAQEMIQASGNQGQVVKRKQELHKQCEAFKAYAHYRWS